jgi:uncharacterized protein (DUF2384 family)
MSSREISLTPTKETVYKKARDVFGRPDKVYSWMNAPNQFFEGMRPVDFIEYASEQELGRVMDELGRIEQGIF